MSAFRQCPDEGILALAPMFIDRLNAFGGDLLLLECAGNNPLTHSANRWIHAIEECVIARATHSPARNLQKSLRLNYINLFLCTGHNLTLQKQIASDMQVIDLDVAEGPSLFQQQALIHLSTPLEELSAEEIIRSYEMIEGIIATNEGGKNIFIFNALYDYLYSLPEVAPEK